MGLTNKERAAAWLKDNAHVECYAYLENRRTSGPDLSGHEDDVVSLAKLLDEVRHAALLDAYLEVSNTSDEYPGSTGMVCAVLGKMVRENTKTGA
jgi:hypothetical protein